jgi:heme A synthase
MARCLHIYDSGFQCIGETVDGTDFCDAHQKVVPFESWEVSTWRKVFFRFVALILLLIFLIPLYYTLRDMYFGPPVKAQEVW